ncbi:DNA polymerase I [Nitrogeniibacter aestuarii]|uniref:DNA polymerase I n=1 Tax=Nitrogeniibacter aestuarii TaxID=2815343 RepID=UPI001D129265|nr:DNA polymerase I [Nitrogeniibacter aestuarii]
MPTLLLVDGSSYLFRAFHAMPDLRNAAGEPTGAVYGVLNMLRRLDSDYPAEYRACVFDAKGKTFRDDWFPEYKANRPSMPEDLAVQIPPLHEAVKARGWPLLMVDGVEADDVIGTLARQASAAGMDVVISTGDKDLTQLVDDRVRWVNTMSNEVLDPAGVEEKFGVPPERIIDYLALVGDSVDNIPGVEKCGPKTAVKWLTQFGTLDNLVEHADEVGGKVGENLRKHLDFLPMGVKLVTVATDLDLGITPADLAPREQDRDKLIELFSHLEFKTWLREVQSGDNPTPAAAASADIDETPAGDPTAHRGEYDTILTKDALDAWIDKLKAAPIAAFDTETTSLDAMAATLVGVSFAVPDGGAAYVPMAHTGPGAPDQLGIEPVLDALRPWLESDEHKKVGQNLKYDMHVLANYGVKIGGIADDTLLASYIIESDKSHDMDSLAKRHLGLETIPYTAICGKGAKQIGFNEVDIEQASEYAAEDADITLRLQQCFEKQLGKEDKLKALYRDIELPAMHVLFEMERNGVLIDDFLLAQHSEELGRRLAELEKEAHELAGQPFNLNSPKQLGELLFGKLELPIVKKTATGQPSTDEEVLQKLAEDYPLPKLLLDYRSLAKLKSTYADKLPLMVNRKTGRVHTSFSQAVAVTGRLASSDPNLQNIPIRTAEGRRIRAAFIAPQGHRIVSADYSQIELRIMAHLSGDKGLLKAFAEGEDVHRATASEIFGVTPIEVSNDQRRYAKVINFGLIYGMSAHGLAKNLDIERSAAANYIDRYFARYPGVADYMARTRAEAADKGYVETVFGRRLHLPDIHARQAGRRQGAERAAINAPMQGTAADLIKLAMVAVSNWLRDEKLKSKLILQVHDELVLEVPDDELSLVREQLPKLMAGVAKLSVPLVAEVGDGANWDEAH